MTGVISASCSQWLSSTSGTQCGARTSSCAITANSTGAVSTAPVDDPAGQVGDLRAPLLGLGGFHLGWRLTRRCFRRGRNRRAAAAGLFSVVGAGLVGGCDDECAVDHVHAAGESERPRLLRGEPHSRALVCGQRRATAADRGRPPGRCSPRSPAGRIPSPPARPGGPGSRWGCSRPAPSPRPAARRRSCAAPAPPRRRRSTSPVRRSASTAATTTSNVDTISSLAAGKRAWRARVHRRPPARPAHPGLVGGGIDLARHSLPDNKRLRDQAATPRHGHIGVGWRFAERPNGRFRRRMSVMSAAPSHDCGGRRHDEYQQQHSTDQRCGPVTGGRLPGCPDHGPTPSAPVTSGSTTYPPCLSIPPGVGH